MSALERLASLAGIEAGYHDIWGNWHAAGRHTQQALLQAMGFAVADEQQIEQSLRQMQQRDWRRPLPPALVVPVEQHSQQVQVCLPRAVQGVLTARLSREDGGGAEYAYTVAELVQLDSAEFGGEGYCRYRLPLRQPLPAGYHRLSLSYRLHGRSGEAATQLIVAPRRCYSRADLAHGQRLWGLSAQLYALRSDSNWGIGDFSDLADFVSRALGAGAAAVGINPLHPLYPADPESCSPYSPTSRSFLNTLYIDVEAVPDLAASAAAREALQSPQLQARLQHLRATEQVDYAAVAACKEELLRLIYADFGDPDSERGRAFARYCAERDPALERLATFDALDRHFRAEDPACNRWQLWPPAFQRPDSPAVQAFVVAHRRQVDYFKYLQWLAEEQLAAAADRAAPMPVGLYLDLAVGCDAGAAAVWAERELYVGATRIGAPADQFCAGGQNWGLIPLNPCALKECGYAPFIALLRDNMRYAGALRIDHVMGLMRQFWVPPEQDASAGVYVNFPLQDLLRIVALESQRARCVVIGEDLGTVPAGFRETMAEAAIQSYRVLYFERWDNGWFKRPEIYPQQSVVTVSTHDLPPLAGWWRGADIECRRQLGLYQSEADFDAAVRDRRADRRALVDALVDEGLLAPAENLLEALSVDTLLRATQAYLARSPGWLQMVVLEDALGIEQQTNMPGTIHEHPNWRRRLPLPVETIFASANLRALLLEVAHQRSLAPAAAGAAAAATD